mmetsp:Transcript_3946/g.9023  ORF Transcript_3946/g.9023 Transcript_3946/m.9023 type:complete len:231 (+) Transcript_3946:23-715(+)
MLRIDAPRTSRNNRSSKKTKSINLRSNAQKLGIVTAAKHKSVLKYSFETLQLSQKEENTLLSKVVRSKSNPANIMIQRRNPHLQFQNDFHSLINAYPEFPLIMMKTLIIRERGNMKAVHSFLQSRGWKSDKKVKNLLDSQHTHFTILHFWGIDKPEYSKILAKKDIGSFFIVLDAPVYYVYFKDDSGIKKQRISTPDILALPFSKIGLFKNPIVRPCTISGNHLLHFPEL